MASPGNEQCANCIGIRSFPIGMGWSRDRRMCQSLCPDPPVDPSTGQTAGRSTGQQLSPRVQVRVLN